MEQKNLQEMQAELDVAKWNEGVEKGNDPCGTYTYCGNCDKAADYPCAQAKIAAEVAISSAPRKKTSAKPASDKVIRARKPRAKKAE